MAENLSDTMDALVACAVEALDNINRAVCRSGLTAGPPAPGPMGCCNKCGSDNLGGQVSGFLERVYPAEKTRDGIQEAPRLTCRGGATAADITVVVLRCYPAMDNKGNMPLLDATTPYAHELNDDLAAVWNGLLCCGTDTEIRESAVDADPEGGCSAFAIRVTTLVSLPSAVLDVS